MRRNFFRNQFILLILAAFLCLGCQVLADKTKPTNLSNTAVENKNQPVAVNSNENLSTETNNTNSFVEEKDLLSFFSGALVVKKTKEYGFGWRAENAID